MLIFIQYVFLYFPYFLFLKYKICFRKVSCDNEYWVFDFNNSNNDYEQFFLHHHEFYHVLIDGSFLK